MAVESERHYNMLANEMDENLFPHSLYMYLTVLPCPILMDATHSRSIVPPLIVAKVMNIKSLPHQLSGIQSGQYYMNTQMAGWVARTGQDRADVRHLQLSYVSHPGHLPFSRVGGWDPSAVHSTISIHLFAPWTLCI